MSRTATKFKPEADLELLTLQRAAELLGLPVGKLFEYVEFGLVRAVNLSGSKSLRMLT